MKLRQDRIDIEELQNEVDRIKRLCRFPPGHFYSPVVDIDYIKSNKNSIWSGIKKNAIPGISLNEQEQISLAKSFESYYEEMPFEDKPRKGMRYGFQNGSYSYTDAITLYAIMRHFKPEKIIEVGSGYSSAAMLDVNEIFFGNRIKLTFIEPYTKKLMSLLKQGDDKHCEIISKGVQHAPIELFEDLKAGDILFIDSTHVAKTGSDVNHIFFEVLPLLAKGVYIHFHDIFYPFEYPANWVMEGRSWNEIYLLKSFLMFNKVFKIRFFSHFLHLHHPIAFDEMPLCKKNKGGNIWLEKI